MAARKKPKPEPIGFYDIKTPRDALRWIKQDDLEINSHEAESLEKQFPKHFVFDNKHFSSSKEHSLYDFSNYRVWKRDFAKTEEKNWWTVDTDSFLVRRDEKNPTDEEEAIDGLDGYPILDEDDHSTLEMEVQGEDWESYGRADLRREIGEKSSADDEDAIDTLMQTVTDEMIDNFAYEARQEGDKYPEMEGSSTIFPDLLEEWDGSMIELGDMLKLEDHGYVSEVMLSAAAFDRGRIILRPQDLPEAVRGLINSPTPIQIKYDAALCSSPYLTCRWTGKKEIDERQRQEEEDSRQQKLPGVEEATHAIDCDMGEDCRCENPTDPDDDEEFLRNYETPKLYEYGTTLRPPNHATVPQEGWTGTRPSSVFKHGVVQYSRHLTQQEIDAFQLVALDPYWPANMRKGLDAYTQMVINEFTSCNPEGYSVTDSLGTRVLSNSTRPGVDFQVTDFDLNMIPTGHRDYNDFAEAVREEFWSRLTRQETEQIIRQAVGIEETEVQENPTGPDDDDDDDLSLGGRVGGVAVRTLLGCGPGELPSIGPETGIRKRNGISKFVSPHGSYRYVAYHEGVPVSVLQVVSRDGKMATIAIVYTLPERRRQGWASKLLQRARKDFRSVEHSKDLTEDAKAWKKTVGENPTDDEYQREIRISAPLAAPKWLRQVSVPIHSGRGSVGDFVEARVIAPGPIWQDIFADAWDSEEHQKDIGFDTDLSTSEAAAEWFIEKVEGKRGGPFAAHDMYIAAVDSLHGYQRRLDDPSFTAPRIRIFTGTIYKLTTMRELFQLFTITHHGSTVWLYDFDTMRPDRVLTLWELIQFGAEYNDKGELIFDDTVGYLETDVGSPEEGYVRKKLWPASEKQWEEGEFAPTELGGPSSVPGMFEAHEIFTRERKA